MYPDRSRLLRAVLEKLGQSDVRIPSFQNISIDSRRCKENSLFIALRGERVDGHEYLADARSHGAVAALVEKGRISESPSGMKLLEVSDPLRTFQAMAADYLGMLQIPTIGVTGSNGKTTTKEMLASVLREQFLISVSRGNFNSETGVPLSVFEVDPASRYAIFEMATNHPGEMGDLSRIVHPHIALILNIGRAHIGNFGSREAIAAEKKAITAFSRSEDFLVIPENDDFSGFLQTGVRSHVEYFGPETQRARYEASGTESTIHLPDFNVQVPLPGVHNVMNALAVIRIAGLLEIDPAAIERGIERLGALAGRSEIVADGERIVLNESYNANPDSVRAGLDAFSRLCDGRGATGRMVILGEMKELGDYSREGHSSVVETALTVEADVIWLVGNEFRDLFQELGSSRKGGAEVRWSPDVATLETELPSYLPEIDAVYLKGSRAVGLERLLPAVTGLPSEVAHA